MVKTMDYKQFRAIFNSTIFGKSKADLLEKVSKNPERYIGIFRPSKPKAKLIQNLLQSHEIRFGDAFETIIEEYLKENGFSLLHQRFATDSGETLVVDHVFSKGKRVFFIEQKIRDDHDSTKKRGQMENFEKKVEVITKRHVGENITGFFYFVDDSFNKNKNYYATELSKIARDYGVGIKLCYGMGLFKDIGIPNAWDEMLKYLKRWKDEIPELPEINFDNDPVASFEEIKSLGTTIFRKLFSNPELDPLLIVIFPKLATLELLGEHFNEIHREGKGNIYKVLRCFLHETVQRLTIISRS